MTTKTKYQTKAEDARKDRGGMEAGEMNGNWNGTSGKSKPQGRKLGGPNASIRELGTKVPETQTGGNLSFYRG